MAPIPVPKLADGIIGAEMLSNINSCKLTLYRCLWRCLVLRCRQVESNVCLKLRRSGVQSFWASGNENLSEDLGKVCGSGKLP